jgi:hypothetical protein
MTCVNSHTKAITSETKIVRIDPRTIVSKVKRSFAWVRCARISVWHKHLRQRETVEQAPAIVVDIVQSQAFAVIKANSECPFLPKDLLSFNCERRIFGLNHLVRLRCGPGTWSEVRVVLAGRTRVYPSTIELALFIVDAFAWADGQAIDLGDLQVLGHLCAEVERICVVVQVLVVRQAEIEPAL